MYVQYKDKGSNSHPTIGCYSTYIHPVLYGVQYFIRRMDMDRILLLLLLQYYFVYMYNSSSRVSSSRVSSSRVVVTE